MKSLKLLICSANLGNAQPDTDSINAWLPDDGEATSLLQSTDVRTKNSNAPHFDKHSKEDSLKLGDLGQDETCFDMIVMGMQEATFEAKKYNSTPTNKNTTKSIKHLNMSGDKLKSVAGRVSGVGVGVAHKGLSTVQTMVASRDHAKTNRNSFNIIDNIGVNVSDWVGGTSVLHELILNRLPSYEIVVGFQRGEMRLIILVRAELVTQNLVEVKSVRAENTGIASVAANKGGIVANLSVNGTRLSFCTAHLEAHEGLAHYNNRLSNLEEILNGTAEKGYDFSISSHFAFVCGDLNFRTVLKGVKKEHHAATVRELVAKKEWEELNGADELQYALKTKGCLNGFETLPCHFPPTFKVERQQGYNYKENRTPSYTDRILWKCANKLDDNIKPFVYEPIDNFSTSDHKPIRGAFEIKLNKKLIPLPQTDLHNDTSKFHRTNKKGGKLHVFFNDLRCVELTARGVAPDPDPYISFVSDPEGLVRKHRTYFKRIKDKIKIGRLEKTDKDGHIVRTSRGWVRTSKKKATNHPNWSDEEIHLVIKTHKPDGSVIEVTGAMLYVTVRDASSMMEDNIIGTFALNLANLYKKSQRRRHEAVDALPTSNKSNKNLLSKIKHFKSTKKFSSDNSVASNSSAPSVKSTKNLGDEFFTIPFNEPLMRNGKEQGYIAGSVETWWFHGEFLKSISTSNLSSSLGHGRRSVEKIWKRKSDSERMTRRAGIAVKTP